MEPLEDEVGKEVSASKDIVAGSCRGVAQLVVGHPLDTVKVRLQTQVSTNAKYKGLMDCLQTTLKEEGILGLYRGASSPLAATMLYSSLLFFSYGQYRHLAENYWPAWLPKGELTNESLGSNQLMLASFMTGWTSALIEGPYELFKCQMQYVDPKHSGPRYSWHCARELTKRHGLRASFSGFGAASVRNSCGATAYFYSYEHFKMTFSRFEWLNHTQQILMAGGISGAMYWISIYPIDVAKSCIQCAAFTDKEHLYSSLFRSLRTIVRTEGVGGLWKGFTPCLVRGIPVNAVSFLAFETSRKYLDSLW